MAPQIINVLLSTFPGLGLPSTLLLQAPPVSSISELTSQIHSRLPDLHTRLIITTLSNKQLSPSCSAPISSLLDDNNPQESKHDLLPLRLSVPLCGGKGGFGSQLRAAGGRMSSRRKKNQGENNGSNRNLDGRRLRTVTEAKALAEYLALKPEMEKKEREARRKRWEQVVELAERKQEELRSGAKGKVDGKWVEDKEEAGERTREAVLAAMKAGDFKDNLMVPPGVGNGLAGSGSASEGSGEDGDDDEEMGGSSSTATTPPAEIKSAFVRKFAGFDDDEFMSEDESEGEADQDDDEKGSIGKGKGRA